MRYNSKFINVLFVLLCMPILICVSSRSTPKPELVDGVYTLPAHLEFNHPNATLLFVDYNSDTAYYKAIEDLPLNIGDTVLLKDGRSCSVLDVSISGFYVDVSCIDIQAGDSGTPVIYNNHIVGYVSTLYDSNTLYCIWDI